MKNVKFAYSFNDEFFENATADSIEEVKLEAQKIGLERNTELEETNTHIYIGTAVVPSNESMFPDADIIIEHMMCQADDIGGDYAESYLNVTDEERNELTKELHALLNKWCAKHNFEPNFFRVSNTQKFDLYTLEAFSDEE